MDICREYGISKATLYNWRKQYAGMDWTVSFSRPPVSFAFVASYGNQMLLAITGKNAHFWIKQRKFNFAISSILLHQHCYLGVRLRKKGWVSPLGRGQVFPSVVRLKESFNLHTNYIWKSLFQPL
jgi:hypothetical protein